MRRRDFLKTTAAVAAVVSPIAVVPAVAANEQPTELEKANQTILNLLRQLEEQRKEFERVLEENSEELYEEAYQMLKQEIEKQQERYEHTQGSGV